MCKMINQYADKIKGQFAFFDRMIINGYFHPLLSEQTRIGYLYSMGIPLRDFTQYFKNVTDRMTERIEANANELSRPVVYLPSAKDKKENIAKNFLISDPVDNGLICVLKTMEACRTAKVVGQEGKHFLKSSFTKCLHYYLYYLDKEFGFMFVKAQTWFPFNIQVYINGRELMKHVFDANGIAYECYDNSFTDISDVAKAQELADKFDPKKLCRRLDGFARSLNPFLDTVQKAFGQGYFWCMDQCEFATDIMFKERPFLEDIYPSLVGHAFYDFSCTDVFTFMGRKPDPRFQGEAVSDYKKRPVGCRVKFKLKSNSVKMYDKCSVLRIETTINDPREFKVFGTVRHHDGSESQQWKPMGKSISNLYRYAQVSKACNQRFIDAMVDIVPVRSVQQEIGAVCSGKTVKGKRIPGFNVWALDVLRIMEAVSDGRYLVNGFRNKDVGKTIFPDMQDAKKRSSRISRTLKKLRQHGLIKKVPRSRRYHVTSKGRRIMGTLIELYHKDYPELIAKKA